MKSIFNLTFTMAFVAFLVLTGCNQNSQVPAQAPVTLAPLEVEESPESPVSSESVATKNNIYVSKEHNFSLEYPSSWQLKDTIGIIITANDEPGDGVWGGTNFNLQYDFESGDVGMTWKKAKEDVEYTNPQGVKFTLAFYGSDETLDETFDIQSDPNDVSIIVNTDKIPGLKLFSYNKSVNPNGEEQLMEILKSVTP